MSDWFQNHRVEWIKKMIYVYGYINRVHVERMFDVSTPQASKDLQRALKSYPGLISYNPNLKRYEYIGREK